MLLSPTELACLAGDCTLIVAAYSLVCIAESKAALGEELDAVDTGVGGEVASETMLRSQILAALKEKPAPELSLSSQDLEVGKN